MRDTLKGKWLLFIALVSTGLGMWANNINQVCLDAIYTEFSEASTFLQGYIVGGTSIASLVFVLIVGILSRKISKKWLLMGGLLLYLVGGLGGGFAQSMGQYAVFRTLMGGATGVLSTVVFSIMFELFPDANDSARIMGTYHVFNTLFGALLSYLAGILCVMNWRTAQWINGGIIISLVCVALFLPQTAPEGAKVQENGEEKAGTATADGPRVALTLVEQLLVYISISVLQYFVAIYLSERQMGDSSFAGILMSVATITGAVINMMFANIFQKLGRYTGVSIVVIYAVFSILLGFNVPSWFVIVAMGINGFASGICYSYYPIAVNQYVLGDNITMFQSMVQVAMYAALFLTSYIPNLFMGIFGGGYQRLMLTTGIAMALIAAVFTVIIKVYINQKKY